MLIATFIVCYRLFCFSQTRFSPTVLLISLCSLMGFVVVAQVSTGDSTVQQIVFTCMAYWLWHTCFKLITSTAKDPVLKKRLRIMAISGIGELLFNLFDKMRNTWLTGVFKAFFISGHLCWMTDYYACNNLRSMRRKIGMPWAAVLELHG